LLVESDAKWPRQRLGNSLSTTIRARGPNQWARFEAIVFLMYSMAINLLTIACSFFYRQQDAFPYFGRLDYEFKRATYFAELITAQAGPSFPMSWSQLWAFYRQETLGVSFWYNIAVNLIVNGSLFLLQLVGVVVTLIAREEVWILTLRYLLLISALVILSFNVVVIMMTLQAINLVHNILSFLLIPNGVQFGFAILYATQSEILPIFKKLPTNYVLRKLTLFSIVCARALRSHVPRSTSQFCSEKNHDRLPLTLMGAMCTMCHVGYSSARIGHGLSRPRN